MALLETVNLFKKFGGLTAVNDLSMQVEDSQICALIGPNGSGKTTVLNVITGIYKDDGGKILFNGKEFQGKMPHEVCEMGIARTFQNIRVLSSLSVYDNVRLGLHIQTKANLPSVLLNLPSLKAENKRIKGIIEEALELVGMLEVKDEIVKNLPYGRQKVLEIARAVVAKPKLLLFDEPAAGLNPNESEELMNIVKKIKETGVSILLIEHEMPFVSGLADKVFVINYGKLISEGTFDEIKKDPKVIEAYLGTRGDH